MDLNIFETYYKMETLLILIMLLKYYFYNSIQKNEKSLNKQLIKFQKMQIYNFQYKKFYRLTHRLHILCQVNNQKKKNNKSIKNVLSNNIIKFFL